MNILHQHIVADRPPTALEFAAAYREPAPANLDALFEALTQPDKIAALGGVRRYREMCARLKVNPVNPKIYLEMRLWERRS